MPAEIFISYAHADKDKPWFKALITQLNSLKLNVWTDSMIQGGQEWRPEIETAIQEARIIVLVLSPDFLASEFIKKHELPCIEKQKSQAKIYPILGVHCAFKKKYPWLAEIQLGGRHAKPLEILNDQLNEVLTRIVNELDDYLNPTQQKKTQQNTPPSHSNQIHTKPYSIEDTRLDTLPYLTDRRAQIKKMILALEYFKKEKPGKPLIWIIHGNDLQCHSNFITCIKDFYWQKRLYPQPDQANIKIYRFKDQLPYDEDIEQWKELIAHELRIAFKIPTKHTNKDDTKHNDCSKDKDINDTKDKNQDNPEDVFKAINHFCDKAKPVLLYDIIHVDEWKKYGKHVVCQRFFDFWEQWPAAHTKHPLIVCWMIQYASDPLSKKRWFFQYKTKTVNHTLKSDILSRPMKDHCLIIPELENVTQKQTHEWREEFKKEIIDACNHSYFELENCIDLIFNNNPTKSLPMKHLVKKLYEVIFQQKPN